MSADIIFFFGRIKPVKAVKAFRKGAGQDAVFTGIQIRFTGIQHPVDGIIRRHKPLRGLFLFQRKNLVKVCSQTFQKGKIIVNVLFSVKFVFCQKDRKLGLDADGGSQGLGVKFQSLAGAFRFQISFQDLIIQLIL